MKPKLKKLLHLLERSNQPLTSSELAGSLGVTSRTVKNYVNEINAQFSECIRSSSQGYRLVKNIDSVMVSHFEVPQNYEERSSYIIHKFFIDHVQNMDLYQLCDELFLSYSSVKQLLSKMNQQLKYYKLLLSVKNDHIFLIGKEQDQRKFLTSIIYKESNGKFVDLGVLKEIFPKINIQRVYDILREVFNAYDYYLNDFSYANMVLHIVVIVDRICMVNSLEERNQKDFYPQNRMVKEIIERIEQKFNVQFKYTEKSSIYELIMMNLNIYQANSSEEMIKNVGEDLYVITVSIIDSVNQLYHLNLNKETLLYPLAFHFKNLLKRSQANNYLKNPLLETIQSSCPMLFDCAIYIGECLKERYGITITRDEIAYISMHIGADIERQSNDNKKLQCVLLCPDYHNNREQLYNFLLIHFDTQISMVATCSFESEIPDLDFDILFTTIPLQHKYRDVICIPPLKSAIQLKDIFNKIQDVIDHKKLMILSENFDSFFQKDMFLYLNHSVEYQHLIYLLSKMLEKNQYVSSDFFEDVLKRESAASTAFGDIAIPHSMNMNAHHTGIAMAISEMGINWQNQIVHIVFLIAINEKESYLFKELYEALIYLFSEIELIQKLQQCKKFQDFRNMLLSAIPSKK